MEIDKAKLQKLIKEYFNGKVPAAVQNAVNSASAEDIKKAGIPMIRPKKAKVFPMNNLANLTGST